MTQRVCFVINQLGGVGIGGSDRVVTLLANAMIELGWRVDICVLTDDRSVDRAVHPDVQLHFLGSLRPRSKRGRAVARISSGIRMIRRYRRSNPESVIVSFIAWVNICAAIASIGFRGPLVLSERTNPATDPSWAPARLVRNVCYSAADTIVFQTPDALAYFRQGIAAKGVVIVNPVTPDLPLWDPSSDSFHFVAASRLESQKNVGLMIRAFAIVASEHPTSFLTVYGEGKERRQLEQLIAELGLETNVSLAGHVGDVHLRMKSASAFVLSSDFEGMPNSLLEAMSMGMPVIATDCPIGGPRMLVANGVNGLLVPAGDAQSLASAMRRLADDRGLAVRMGERARASSARYELSAVAESWAQLVVASSQGRRD